MPHRLLPPVLVFLSLCFSFLAGCGQSGPEKIEVFGKVTFNGQPIADGDIAFHPEAGTSGPLSSGPIKDGAYRLSDNWALVPGTYRVVVNAYRPSADTSKLIEPGGQLDRPPETPGIPRRDQILPEKFNEKSTIEKLVVASGQKRIEKNYDLK